jgi:hypothetical protein
MTVDQLATLVTDLEKRVTAIEAEQAPVGAKKPADEPRTELPKKDIGSSRHDR